MKFTHIFFDRINSVLLLLALLFSIMHLKAQTDESSKYEWKKVAIGGGGYVTGVVFSEARCNVIYSRTDVGGAYRWDSINNSWIPLFDFLTRAQFPLSRIESVAADPSDENRVYFACGDGTGSSVGGIFWSNDQGKTMNYVNTSFKMAGNGSGRGIGERLAVDPNKNNIIYFSSRVHGLWRSADYAKTWSKITSFPVTSTTDGVGLCFVILDKKSSTFGDTTRTIYVGVSRKGDNLYKSTDAGKSWTLVVGTPATLQPHGAAIDTSGIMYLTYGDGPGPGVDGTGAVWKYNTNNLAWTNITPAGSWGGYGGISIDKHKPGTLMVATGVNWGGGAKIYRSINEGTSWKTVSDSWSQQPLDAPYLGTGTGNWIESLKIDPFNSGRVMYCTGAGIWACSDVTENDFNRTTHWETAVKGIEEAGAYHILSPPSGAMLFLGFGDIGGFRHEDIKVSPATKNWFGWNYGHGIDFAQNNPNIMVRNGDAFGTPIGKYSINNGVTWTNFATLIPGAGSNGEKIQISANGTSVVWSPENLVPYYSFDKGASWVACAGLPAGYYNSMTSDRVSDNKFYYYHKSSGYIYISVNGGANFTKAGYIATWGQRITACPTVEGDIWVPVYGQGNNGLWHSVNSGASFTKMTLVQEATSVSLGRSAPGKKYPTIYIYGKINNLWGVYSSVDTAKTWRRISDPAHQYGWIDFLVADQRTYGRVYLSPNCMGIPYSQLKYDCNGDSAGTAYYDWCDSCVGGNTGNVSACEQDCKGVWGGKAFLDSCENCVDTTIVGEYPCVTSIIMNKAESFRFSPNPFNQSMQLSLLTPSLYIISTTSGETVESGYCSRDCFIGSNLNSGFYFLTIRNRKEEKTVKIVKQ